MYKIGQGIDIHKLKKGRYIYLSGNKYDCGYSIDAFSDGDIILHSLTSSILGALSMRDLGTYFPDYKSENKNRKSIDFFNFALKEMESRSMKFSNIDINIICEKIIFKDLIPSLIESLQNITNCSYISIKATRFEDKSNMTIQVLSNILLENSKKNDKIKHVEKNRL
jgi:2-C-methyl-D-erythritol 2,4-cyclodiphosphate synthase